MVINVAMLQKTDVSNTEKHSVLVINVAMLQWEWEEAENTEIDQSYFLRETNRALVTNVAMLQWGREEAKINWVRQIYY